MAFWLMLLLGVVSQSAFAQDQPLSVAERNALQGFNDTIDRLAPDFVTVSLVVCDPGEIMYSVLGHACLHLQCPSFGMDYIFSYESESVEGKVRRFLMNDLKMGMMALEMDDYMAPYIAEERGVKEYILNLPPEVKTELWRMCDERMMQGMNLEYDPVKRGCAISVVHSVEDAIKSANRMYGTNYQITYPEWGAPFDRTLREIFYDNAPHDWGLFFCMTIVGGIVDKPHLPHKEKLICPKELADTWMQCSIDGKPLISEPVKILNEGKIKKTSLFSPVIASLVVLILAILSFFLKVPYIDWLILGGQTLFGCLMLWLWLSPLPATGWSWLLIPFNILPALCWYWRKYWALPWAVVLLGWCIVMAGEFFWGHVLVDWAHILLVLSFCIILLWQHFLTRAA
ncbi:MAG: DUF4105 domain-containing protein [Paludibacteraceae bacterium]|nr:DUF4105 domain-containing protein [Paludibacteraceae bacterium]